MPPTDPISLILEALTLGIKNIATEEVKNIYTTLKALLQEKLASSQTGKYALNNFEKQPDNDASKVVLTKELKTIHADEDVIIVREAEALKRVAITKDNIWQHGTGNTLINGDQTSSNGNSNIVTKANPGNGSVVVVGRDYFDKKISISFWQLILVLIFAGFFSFGGGVGWIYKILEQRLSQPPLEPPPALPFAPSSTPPISPLPLSRDPTPPPVSTPIPPGTLPPGKRPVSPRPIPPPAPPPVGGEPPVSPSPEPISDPNCKPNLNAFRLVDCAYNGSLRDYGIPGYSALIIRYKEKDVDAEAIVQAGIAARLLPSETLQDQDYLGAVESHLQGLEK